MAAGLDGANIGRLIILKAVAGTQNGRLKKFKMKIKKNLIRFTSWKEREDLEKARETRAGKQQRLENFHNNE